MATAQGEAARFLADYTQYRTAKDVTTKRLYLETMEEVLRGSNKIILDSKDGVQPYLPLTELQRRLGQPAQTPGPQR